MPLHSVSAGRITHIGYEDNTLYVRFVNDSLYAYYNVPIQEYQNLMSAALIGDYFYEHIKGVYKCERVG